MRMLVATGSPSAGHAAAGAMTLDLSDCSFVGPAFPAPFVHFELTGHLARLGLLPATCAWKPFRQQLRPSGDALRVCNHVIVPLASSLGFGSPVRQDDVSTREGAEDR